MSSVQRQNSQTLCRLIRAESCGSRNTEATGHKVEMDSFHPETDVDWIPDRLNAEFILSPLSVLGCESVHVFYLNHEMVSWIWKNQLQTGQPKWAVHFSFLKENTALQVFWRWRQETVTCNVNNMVQIKSSLCCHDYVSNYISGFFILKMDVVFSRRKMFFHAIINLFHLIVWKRPLIVLTSCYLYSILSRHSQLLIVLHRGIIAT